MKKIRINGKGKFADKAMEKAFAERNAAENLYYEEFRACKKSWIQGTLWGILAGIGLGFLFSGFEFNDIFFGMSGIMSISCAWCFSTLLGLKYTEDFGCSCIPIGIFSVAGAILSFFAGTYVLAWVALLLLGIALGAWLFGMFVFAMLFPLETLYYWIRYSIEKNAVRKTMERELFQMA